VLIAIDTADEYIGLAAYSERGLLAEVSWVVGQNHSVELLPGLKGLLEKLKTDLRAIQAVGVSLGPGSFNGIRVGVSTAKALAYGLGAALVGVPTLEAHAWQFAAFGLPVCCIQPAGRDVIFAVFDFNREPVRLVPERVGRLEELPGLLPGPAVISGSLPADRVEELRRHAREGWVVVFGAAGRRRPAVLAEVAWRRFISAQTDDPATLEPLYVRPPQVTPPRRTPFGPGGP
jgi:tRNA threonylcarbamoyladenosine biosynthesis protein TsaB